MLAIVDFLIYLVCLSWENSYCKQEGSNSSTEVSDLDKSVLICYYNNINNVITFLKNQL